MSKRSSLFVLLLVDQVVNVAPDLLCTLAVELLVEVKEFNDLLVKYFTDDGKICIGNTEQVITRNIKILGKGNKLVERRLITLGLVV